MLTVELLPELDAAIAHLRGELAQLRAGALDEQLHALAQAPPLPEPQFSALLRAWEPPPAPEALVALARSLAPSDGGSNTLTIGESATVAVDLTACESDDDHATAAAATAAARERSDGDKAEDDAEAALAGLRELRRSMLLDVLSKIRSVAKSKGVDPAMVATRRAEFMDLEAIARAVESGAVAEWELFAHQVFLFCQHVIADSETRAAPAAKQKGVELLHFARTLTETLRKASAKKEEALLQEIESKRRVAAQAKAAAAAAAQQQEQQQQEEDQEEEEAAEEDQELGADAKRERPPALSLAPPTSASPSSKRLSVDALTPNRVSARIRQRGSSFSSGDASARLEDADADAETRAKKRPRAASNTTTASEDEVLSESESQLSAASEAESLKRRRAKAAPATPATRTPRTRQRRPVLPATRASSRQQKRRAAHSRARAADEGDEAQKEKEEEEEASDAAGNGDEDTAQDDDDEEPASDAGATPPPPPSVPLTKAGRPRKRPGRKPAGWKKSDAK